MPRKLSGLASDAQKRKLLCFDNVATKDLLLGEHIPSSVDSSRINLRGQRKK